MTNNEKDSISLREITEKKIHHGKKRFINPFSSFKYGKAGPILAWKLFGGNPFKKYYRDQPVTPVSIDWDPVKKHYGLSITYLRHACLLIKDIDRYILIDPVFWKILWFVRDFSPLSFDLKEMPKPHHILITHGHYDHLNIASLRMFDKNTHLVTPMGYDRIFQGLRWKRRDQLDWFDTISHAGMEFTLLPSCHWTMRNPITGPNRSLWGSYLIKTASGFTILIAGDTGYYQGFKEIGQEFDIDLAVFNVSAYEPRWYMKYGHMNPSEAVRAFQDLRAKHMTIIHWGTFRLGLDPVHFPPIHVREEMEKKGLNDRFLLLNHGETLFYDQIT